MAIWSCDLSVGVASWSCDLNVGVASWSCVNLSPQRCDMCKDPGATVGCCASWCSANYHFHCARKNGCIFLQNKEVFCREHTSLAEDKVCLPHHHCLLQCQFVFPTITVYCSASLSSPPSLSTAVPVCLPHHHCLLQCQRWNDVMLDLPTSSATVPWGWPRSSNLLCHSALGLASIFQPPLPQCLGVGLIE